MDFLPFFLVLLVSVVFAAASRTFHLPWALGLIIAGIFIGPFGFGVVETTPTLEFIGQVGLVFLMFMAGLETKPSNLTDFRRGVFPIAILNAAIPFAIGYGIGYMFAFDALASLLLGIIFMSSSIAVTIPTLESTGMIKTKLGRSILSATILVDAASLVLLSVLLQTVNPITSLPLPSFYFLLAIVLIAFLYGLPKLRALVPQRRDEKDLFESEVRIILVMLLGTVVTFELLGLHPIIAGFFAGFVLSNSITSKLLLERLRTLGYGIFIPVFFVIVGMQTDMSVFTNGGGELALVATIVVGSVVAKLGSGWIGARISGFRQREAFTVGIATIPQLSTTLAVAFTAVELDILPNDLITAMVVLSIVTTLIAPVGLRLVGPKQLQS